MLEQHRDNGFDFFKVHNLFEGDVLTALTRDGTVPVIGHLPIDYPTDQQLAAGLSMIAHSGLFYYSLFFDNGCLEDRTFWDCVDQIEPDESLIPPLANAIAQTGAYVTPNLSYLVADSVFTADFPGVLNHGEFTTLPESVQQTWENDGPDTRSFPENRVRDLQKSLPFLRRLTLAMFDAGVPLLSGTDAPLPGLFPGLATHLDLEQLVVAGLTPEQALRTATANASDFVLRHHPEYRAFGRILPGHAADLVVLDQNPLDDTEALRSVWGVLLRGDWNSLDDLEAARTGT